MRVYPLILFLSASALLPLIGVIAQTTAPILEVIREIDSDRMMTDIAQLSSPSFDGRQAGTPGGRRSADFVASRMKQLGLLAGGHLEKEATTPSWFQQEPISVTRLLNTPVLEFSSLHQKQSELASSPRVGSDFLPILDSPAADLTAPIVFVGYGIDNPARGVNDYDGIDVRNRIVMFLRGKPSQYPKWVTHSEKEQTAREKGAEGFITMTGPTLNPYEARRGMGHVPLAMYSGDGLARPLPGCWISGELAKQLFKVQGLSLREIQTKLNEGQVNQSQQLNMLAHLQWDSTNQPGALINVLGVLPGQDPNLKRETIIVGAHRDHFGQQAGLLFAGADDNASGTAVLLEVARLLAHTIPGPKRTILFISFSGEERGLIGSRLYVKRPVRPLNTIVAMVNLDHVGVGNGQLTVGISQLPKTVGYKAADLVGLREKTNFYGFFPGGDHVPFAEKNIPTIAVVSSGPHPFFHQPSDTVDRIQPEILEMATQYVATLVWLLANTDDL